MEALSARGGAAIAAMAAVSVCAGFTQAGGGHKLHGAKHGFKQKK